MANCKHCQESIIWKTSKAGKFYPVNSDGQFHSSTCKPTPVVAPKAINPSGIKAMFAKAEASIALTAKAGTTPKGLKVRLALETREVVISQAKAESSNPGALYVKVDGTYVGKITAKGDWLPTGKTEGLADLLVQFSLYPAFTASLYGKLLGRCSFCSLKLSDDRSMAVGYGKVCAEHWSLPWGDDKYSIKTQVQAAVDYTQGGTDWLPTDMTPEMAMM